MTRHFRTVSPARGDRHHAFADATDRAARDFIVPRGADVAERLDAHLRWRDAWADLASLRSDQPFDDFTNTTCRLDWASGDDRSIVNFATQDYLNLSSHSRVKAAAKEAVRRFGTLSSGPVRDSHRSRLAKALQKALNAFLHTKHTVLFPSGWAAGYDAIRALVRTGDHVVIDQYSSACLQDGANAATQNVCRFRHLDIDYCRGLLAEIRSHDSTNGILVVTESLFALDSGVADLNAMQQLCREFNATLLIDVSHDIGCLGDTGHGQLGIQGVLGQIDIVVGSFAKSFAASGGFVACNNPAAAEYVRCFGATEAASYEMPPAQAAVILTALDVIQSDEGREQRAALIKNAKALRAALADAGFALSGVPSGIVSVKMQSETEARLLSAALPAFGVLAHLPTTGARFESTHIRMLVTANHCERNIATAVSSLCSALNHVTAPQLPAPQIQQNTVLPFLTLVRAA